MLYFVLHFAYAAVCNLRMEQASLGRVRNRGSVCRCTVCSEPYFEIVCRSHFLSPSLLGGGGGGGLHRRRSEQTSYKRKYIKLYQLNWGHGVNGNLSNRGIVRITNR
jgi:hypothetical protein